MTSRSLSLSQSQTWVPPRRLAAPLAEEGTTSFLAFALFILVNAVVFIRPAEIFPDLQNWRLYESVIIPCLLLSALAIPRQLVWQRLVVRPINLCVLGMLVAILLSHLSHLKTWEARMTALKFAKALAYFLLLVVNVNTLSRLRWFLVCLAGFIVILTLLAVLQYHEVIHIEALVVLEERQRNTQTDEITAVLRLRSTGVFNDPNDLSLILLAGIGICVYWLIGRSALLLRLVWVLPLGLFCYALTLTQSRGGFLGFLTALLVIFRGWYGWGKTILLGGMVLPVMLALFAGRQTNINLEDGQDTSQARIQLWSEALGVFREAPLFGIGADEMVERGMQVAHNTFVHCFAELGLFGGTIFLGAFYSAIWSLRNCLDRTRLAEPGELQRLRPYLLAILVGYAVGMLSLSRAYVEPTYMILGLASAFVGIADCATGRPTLRFDSRLAKRWCIASVVFLASTYVFVRVFAQWSGHR